MLPKYQGTNIQIIIELKNPPGKSYKPRGKLNTKYEKTNIRNLF